MPKRLATIAAMLGSALVLFAVLPISLASAAEPWWQVLSGSRPTNMWEPADAAETQEATGEAFVGIFAARVEVAGKTVGCLGSGELPSFLGGTTATQLCEEQTGHPASETASELREMLEGSYAGVKVTGGPAGGAPFAIESPWGPPVTLSVLHFELFGGSFPAGVNVGAKVLSEGSGRLVVTLTNLGDAPVDGAATPVQIVDRLPAGVTAYGVETVAGGSNHYGPVKCTVRASEEVACAFENELPSYEAIELEILVSLAGSPPVAGAAGEVTVSGGGAEPASVSQTVKVSPKPAPFGVEQFSAVSEEEGGGPSVQAGGHPFQYTTTLQLNAGPVVPSGVKAAVIAEARDITTVQPGLPRNLRFSLPAGFVGNATLTPKCQMKDFLNSVNFVDPCPDESVLGVSSVTAVESGNLGMIREAVPVFNLPPASGEPARFGLLVVGVPVFIDTEVDPDDHYKIVASVKNIPQTAQLLSTTTTLWGTPGDPRHDSARGWHCVYFGDAGECKSPHGHSEAAFLRQPAGCSSPLDFGLELEPWNAPVGSQVDSAVFTGDPLRACNQVPFDPSVSGAPTSKLAENPSGLDFELDMPNSGLLNKDGVAEAQPERVEVTLPEGVTVNPSEGEGLVPCTLADYGRETAASRPGEGCPEASKIGNVQVKTPLLEEELTGALYLATPYENQFHTLIALYLVAKAPDRGVVVKLAGKVVPNPVTGQLVTTFEDTPQLPFSSFKLHFREGGRAPLVTPPTCGTYQTVASMLPWSAVSLTSPAPDEIVTRTSPFTIERGVDGEACPANGTPPFKPNVIAGMQNNAAGSYSSFYLRIGRGDGEQEITGFSTQMPSGLTGNLSGIPFCSEADIARARAQTGAEAEVDPACPVASRIGHTVAEAGVGSVLAQTPGKLYLGGPFEGAPFSLVSVTSAKVGPFDLGTVVVHLPLRIDPYTARVSIPSGPADQIPHILKGIVIHLRAIRVYVDRPDFMINPTSCEPMSVQATVIGSGANFASSADDVPAVASNRFQDANCASLAFKPAFSASTSARTSRADGASLKVKLTYPKAPFGTQANIKSVHVELPKAMPSRLTTLNHACLDSVFNKNPADCPSQSRVGSARAVTPVLPVPLEGPAYFVSHGGKKFPELVVILQGYGVTVYLQGETFISKAGITSSTFKSVPDVPVSSFELTLPRGEFSALAANRDLCAAGLTMPTVFSGQNGARLEQSTPIEVQGCPYSLRIVHRRVHKRTLTLKVSVPAAGRLTATGRSVTKASKKAKGRQTLTLKLKERRSGKLRTKILLRFTPNSPTGKHRAKKPKILHKSLTVTFR